MKLHCARASFISSECCMKCIVYAKQAFLTANNSEILMLKYLQRVGSSALKCSLCTLCCLIFLPVWERTGILLARKVLPTLPNSAFEDKGCFGGQWKLQSLFKKLQVICFQRSAFCSLDSSEHLHSLCKGGFLMKNLYFGKAVQLFAGTETQGRAGFCFYCPSPVVL